MTKRTEALDKLIKAVEAGPLDSIWHGCSSRRGHWAYETGLDDKQRNQAWGASHGSLDAALALHEALLPGWDYIIALANGGLTAHVQLEEELYFSDTTARAWLLATLSAYRGLQPKNDPTSANSA